MGRPKGSKNKPKIVDIVVGDAVVPVDVSADPPSNPPLVVKAAALDAPIYVTIALTDEDLAPARQKAEQHKRAAEKMRQQMISAEIAQRERGEITELSVPQVAAFDISTAFKQIAMRKARDNGMNVVSNLRKTPSGWVFEGSYDPQAA